MNAVSKKQFKQLIESFDFMNLFNHLGWNYIKGQDTVKVRLKPSRCSRWQKGVSHPGVQSDSRGRVPDYSTAHETGPGRITPVL